MLDATKFQDFTELTVWKEARKFQHEIYQLTKQFPTQEKNRLTDQIIRSSRSIAANIAEGHGRYHFSEQIRFVVIARGSNSETLNHLIAAYDCSFISNEELKKLKEKYDQLLKLINGYIAFLRKQKSNSDN